MAKSANQKLKLLYLARMFYEKTDENHPVTVQEMINFLGAKGITAERKSIYDDVASLEVFGLDIIRDRGRYYLGQRSFELAELKLLVDSVQSSKFITENKTLSLIKKIESLASVHDASLLQRQVYVRGRVKSMNESVYYNVDEISSAISNDREIRFKYFEYDISKEKRLRRGGEFYEVSPFALMWDDENYYLLAYEAPEDRLKHFRVDKMQGISVLESRRRGREAFARVDMSAYSKMVFGMFGGLEQTVRLRFAAHLVGAVIDRFGKEIMIVPDGEEYFTVSVTVAVSPQFYGWLFGFGDEVEVLSPESVRNEMKNRLAATAARY